MLKEIQEYNESTGCFNKYPGEIVFSIISFSWLHSSMNQASSYWLIAVISTQWQKIIVTIQMMLMIRILKRRNSIVPNKLASFFCCFFSLKYVSILLAFWGIMAQRLFLLQFTGQWSLSQCLLSPPYTKISWWKTCLIILLIFAIVSDFSEACKWI